VSWIPLHSHLLTAVAGKSYTLGLVAACVLVYARSGRRLSAFGVTGALVFTALGLVLGDKVLGWVHFRANATGVATLVEATLALVLFTDAARIDVRRLRRGLALPGRLLGIGLPLTMALGAALAAAVFPALGWREAVLLGVILAPTDAALGQPVVADPRLSLRLRQGLNVESGLNDGIAMPFFTVLLAAVVAQDTGESTGRFFEEISKQLGWGLMIGALAGAVGALALRWPQAKQIHQSARGILVLSVPFVAYGLAVPLGGSGFIAAFVAGLIFGTLARDVPESSYSFAEDTGQVLTLLAFFVFGGVALSAAVGGPLALPLLYALLSLTVIRMLPVAVSLLGSGERAPTVAFCGWFGPRGLASVLLLVLLLEAAPAAPGVGSMASAITWTVVLSVILHGVSARPLTAQYARWYAGQGRAGRSVEEAEVYDHRIRRAGPAGEGDEEITWKG
jgi:NhaP-type Na+/H+ or K+/H+ antiporter